MRHSLFLLFALLLTAGCGGDSGGPGPAPTGVVKIDVFPDGLAADWTLTHPDATEQDGRGDARLAGLEPGAYAVTFADVPGWSTPAATAGTLAANDSITLSGIYFEIATAGSVRIDIEPDELDAAWVLKVVLGDGEYDVTGRGDLTVASLPPGPFTVHWEAIPGWTSAETIHEGVVVSAQTVDVDVTYTLEPAWPFETVLLEAGAFPMGSPENEPGRQVNEGPRRLVTLSRDIEVAVTEVTLAQWEAVTGLKRVEDPTLHNQPVRNLSWYAAVDFCNDMSVDFGYTPAYTIWGDGAVPDSIACDLDADGWRLPTEAEWEALCRAGTTSATSAGELQELGCDRDPVLSYYGWTCGNADAVRPVRALRPNPLGLYDVHGNVSEWVWDRYDADAYSTLPDLDPVHSLLVRGGGSQVVRGGSYAAQSQGARSASRFGIQANFGLATVGLRPVRTVGESR